jgi:predicted RNA-binding protein with PUA-like domain
MTPTRYWLFKSEPSCYSFSDLMNEPNAIAPWEGVRNYQARNYIRDDMKIGDGVLFYHSSCEVPAVVGTAEIVSAPYPDPTQFDPASEYFDEKAAKDNPRWFLVDIKARKQFSQIVTLAKMKQTKGLENMVVLRKGNRLSITPVTKSEWDIVCKIGEK